MLIERLLPEIAPSKIICIALSARVLPLLSLLLLMIDVHGSGRFLELPSEVAGLVCT